MQNTSEVAIIGAAIVDVLVQSVDAGVFVSGSYAAEGVRMTIGGDAINEATVLARLGCAPMLITRLGDDGAADVIAAHCRREGIALHAERTPGLDTGVNVVLVSPDGERSFVTNPHGSLRKLSLQHILPALETETFRRVRAVCLASLFVSPMLTLKDTEALFARVKAAGKLLCADTTRRKNGETLADAAPALRHLDFFFPNLTEAQALSGCSDPEDAADAFLAAGVKNVVLKLGSRGCLVRNARERILTPCYPVEKCVDTTGAGDTFAASFLAALLENRPLEQCAAFANAAASICVEHLGSTAGALSRSEVERRCEVLLRARRA